MLAVVVPLAAQDGQHDFDFNIGTSKTHIRRLKEPLTGSTTWYEMNGAVSVFLSRTETFLALACLKP